MYSAKATIISALQRNESRCSSKSDFPTLDPLFQFNSLVRMDDDNNLKISKVPLKELNEKQKQLLKMQREEDIRNKLLE